MNIKTSLIALGTAVLFLGLLFAVGTDNTQVPAKSELTLFTVPLATLPPHTHGQEDNPTDPGHGKFVTSEPLLIDHDQWITEIKPVISGAPYPVIHHLMLEILNKKDHLCTNQTRKVLVVGSDNNTVVTFPEPYGYLLKKGDELRIIGVLHNAEKPLGTGETYANVSAGFSMQTTTENPSRSKEAFFYMLGLEDPPYCMEEYTFTIPAHSPEFSIHSDQASKNNSYAVFPTNGVILGMGTHTHAWQGGGAIDVFINEKLYRRFFSEKQDTIPASWISEVTHELIPVSAGDEVTMTGYYHNPHDVPTNGAMAITGLYFSPASNITN